jgi:hypothetical protein
LERLTEKKSHQTIQDLPSWVPDWTSGLPRPSKFHSKYLKEYVWESLILIIDLVQGSSIPTSIVRHSETITRTSLPLSLGQVSEGTRQAIASRLANLDIRWESVDDIASFWIEHVNIDGLNDIWAEVYPIWRRIVEDDEILGQELVELSLMDERDPRNRYHPQYRILLPSLPLYLVLAFASNTTFSTNYITDRVLARTSGGTLALVDNSTQEGDVIMPLSDTKERVKEYLVRPMQQVYNHIGDDAKIREFTLRAITRSRPETEWSVLHCELIADCVREGFNESLGWRDSYKQHQEFILALH